MLGEMEYLDSPWAEVDTAGLHRVTRADQAAIIVDPARARFLHPFLGRECTVAVAAQELGLSVNTMLYRVRRMLAADLLEVVREVPRSGRAVKMYRSTHPGYLVPMDAMRYDDLHHRVSSHGRTLTHRLTRDYTAVLARASTDGARVLARTPQGDPWSTDLTPSSDHRGRPVHFSDVTVQLTHEEAALIRQLLLRANQRALDANRNENLAGHSAYLLVTALLPTESE